MTIYQIDPDVDNYCSLLVAEQALAATSLLAFDGTPRSARWNQPLVAVLSNAKAPMPDILDTGAGNLVLYGRSSIILREELAEQCELLPVVWDKCAGEVVNVLGLSDCLDAESSKWVIGIHSGKRIRIEKYEFFEHKVPQRLMFKIPERRFETFCTDEFASFLELHEIKGVNLVPVWTNK